MFHHLRGVSHISYRLNHMQTHFHATVCVIASGNRQTGNTVVTVTQELYA